MWSRACICAHPVLCTLLLPGGAVSRMTRCCSGTGSRGNLFGLQFLQKMAFFMVTGEYNETYYVPETMTGP